MSGSRGFIASISVLACRMGLFLLSPLFGFFFLLLYRGCPTVHRRIWRAQGSTWRLHQRPWPSGSAPPDRSCSLWYHVWVVVSSNADIIKMRPLCAIPNVRGSCSAAVAVFEVLDTSIVTEAKWSHWPCAYSLRPETARHAFLPRAEGDLDKAVRYPAPIVRPTGTDEEGRHLKFNEPRFFLGGVGVDGASLLLRTLPLPEALGLPTPHSRSTPK